MKKRVLVLAGALLIAGAALSKGSRSEDQVAHGRYLVESVAMCADCHSPRNEKGEFIKEKWLDGGPLDFRPVHPIPNWVDKAPSIVGVPPGWTDEEMVELLKTGVPPTGRPLRPPMPQYRMTHADAAAVVAYLKSLRKADK